MQAYSKFNDLIYTFKKKDKPLFWPYPFTGDAWHTVNRLLFGAFWFRDFLTRYCFRAFYIHERHVLTPYFNACNTHIRSVLYSRKYRLVNIAKIKRLRRFTVFFFCKLFFFLHTPTNEIIGFCYDIKKTSYMSDALMVIISSKTTAKIFTKRSH